MALVGVKFRFVLVGVVAAFLVAGGLMTQAQAQSGSQYAPEGPYEPGEEIAATGILEKRIDATIFQYGTHDLNDGETGELIYALTSDSIDLDAYDGEMVTIYGTLVHNGLSGGPPYVNVYQVTLLDGAGGTTTSPGEDNGSMDDTDGSGVSNGSVEEATGEEAARASDSAGSIAEQTGVQVLPSTGGASLVLLQAGALLMAAGLLVRRAMIR